MCVYRTEKKILYIKKSKHCCVFFCVCSVTVQCSKLSVTH